MFPKMNASHLSTYLSKTEVTDEKGRMGEHFEGLNYWDWIYFTAPMMLTLHIAFRTMETIKDEKIIVLYCRYIDT